MSYQEIELSRIRPNPANPRKHFDGQKFDDLVASIRIKGVLQPIVIRPKDEAFTFEIVAGERRWRAACKIAEENGGLRAEKIPAMVRDLTDDEAFDVMCIENLQREDLTEREEAESFKAFLDHKGEEGLPELAERTGIDARYIRRRVRILTLPAPVLEAWEKGKLVYGHLEQLRRLEDEKEILRLFKDITAPNWWEARQLGESAKPVIYLKRILDERSIPFKYAFFDKSSCKSCSRNTQVQKDLFGLGSAMAACVDPICFKKKLNDWLMIAANWKTTSWAKKQKTNGFRFGNNLDYGIYQSIYDKPHKDCLTCQNLCSIIYLDSERQSRDPACFDPACYRQKFQRERSSGTKVEKAIARAKNHGEQFREVFYSERFPLAAARIPADDAKNLRLALVAMIYKDHKLVKWFAKQNKTKKGRMVGYRYQSAPELWAVVKDMDRQTVLKNLQDAAIQISMQADYGAKGRQMIAEHFGIDLAKEWRITEDYLKAKTIKEILVFGKTLDFWSNKKAQAYLYKKLGKKRGAFESCKKTDLIKVILQSGIDLAGKVPAEILKVEK